MTGPWRLLDGPAGGLRCYSTAPTPTDGGATLLLAHELPLASQSASDTGRTFPALADRLAEESGWRVVTATLRGAGGSDGDFSADGWLEDLAFVAAHELDDQPRWMAGFGLGGALALRMAAADDRVRGVACLGTPTDLTGWVTRPELVVDRCRESGVITGPGFPEDVGAWAGQLAALDPLGAAAALERRSLLVLHGLADAEVPVADARALTAAAPGSELRLIPGAGHWLRADPRVVATLLGWLERRR
jgi:putative redox protein